MSPNNPEETTRVLVETLRQSKHSKILSLEQIAEEAKTTKPVARAIVQRFLGIMDHDGFSVGSKSRVQLALEIARAGRLKDAAKALTWQEFESFGAECLSEAGFRVEKNVRIKGDGRAWQLDLIGYRGDLVLTVDCKHWDTPGYESRLAPHAEHQRCATAHLLRELAKKTTDRQENLQGLATILTLVEPPARFLENSALLSVEQLPGFLNSVTPHDANLPLISTSDILVENPMS